MKNPNNPCIFCFSKKKDYLFENQLAYATSDTYPVSKFHSLIIPKRCVKNYFDLTSKEILACNNLIKKLKKKLRRMIYLSKVLILAPTQVRLLDNLLIIATSI